MIEKSVVVVERSFSPEVDAAPPSERVDSCRVRQAVREIATFVSLDRREVVSLYEAPDADAVRELHHTAGVVYQRLWPALSFVADESPSATPIIVERELPPEMTMEEIDRRMAAGEGCLRSNRVRLLRSQIGFDQGRMLCVFEAPDAESVRHANRQLGLPVSRVWAATVKPLSG